MKLVCSAKGSYTGQGMPSYKGVGLNPFMNGRHRFRIPLWARLSYFVIFACFVFLAAWASSWKWNHPWRTHSQYHILDKGSIKIWWQFPLFITFHASFKDRSIYVMLISVHTHINGLFLYLHNAKSIITAYFHMFNGDYLSNTVGSDEAGTYGNSILWSYTKLCTYV